MSDQLSSARDNNKSSAEIKSDSREPLQEKVPLIINGASDKAVLTVTNRGVFSGGGAGISGNAPVGNGVEGTGLTGVSGNGSNKGTGVYGYAEDGIGVNGYGGATGKGVHGSSTNGYGVYGIGGYGVYGESTSPTGKGVFGKGNSGVYGMGTGTNGAGVFAVGSKYGIYAMSSESNGLAAYLPGQVETGNLSVNGSITAFSCKGCSPPSDRNLKANFLVVNQLSILNRLSTVPIQSWNYKSDAISIRHLGPTAQDFRAAFSLGDSDKVIETVDANGVALAAIQGLYQLIQERDRKIELLQRRLAVLERRMSQRTNSRQRRR